MDAKSHSKEWGSKSRTHLPDHARDPVHSNTSLTRTDPVPPESKINRKKDRKKEKKRRKKTVEPSADVLAEISMHRAMFHGKDILPDIGDRPVDTGFKPGAVPKIMPVSSHRNHDNGVEHVLDVISRKEAEVKVKSNVKVTSQNYMKVVGDILDIGKPNNIVRNAAPEIIGLYEDRVGKAYARHGYTYTQQNQKVPLRLPSNARARSRMSSVSPGSDNS